MRIFLLMLCLALCAGMLSPVQAYAEFFLQLPGVEEALAPQSPYTALFPQSNTDSSISFLKTAGGGHPKGWHLAYDSNLDSLYQATSTESFPGIHSHASNLFITGIFRKDGMRLTTTVGAIEVSESPYTLSGLMRRGGSFSLDVNDNYGIRFFALTRQMPASVGENSIVEGSSNDGIFGVSAKAKLFDKRLELKTVYITAEEPSDFVSAYPVYPSDPAYTYASTTQRGEVIGFMVTSDFLNKKLVTEFETNLSYFDPSSGDEFKGKSDRAHRLKIGGALGRYTYDLTYEYIGRDYAVIGNPYLARDIEGITLRSDANFRDHRIQLSLSRYNDNVMNDELYPRILTYQTGIDYFFTKIKKLPMSIGYHKTIQRSTMAPSEYYAVDTYSDSMVGTVSYLLGNLRLRFDLNYSFMDDKTLYNRDTTAITYRLMPSYTFKTASLYPSVTFSRSKDYAARVITDTYMANLDLNKKIGGNASLTTGGGYSIVKMDNYSLDTRTITTRVGLSYSMKHLLKNLLNPTFTLRGDYSRVLDRILRYRQNTAALFINFSTGMPLLF